MKNIRRDRYGYRVYVKSGGKQLEKRFPPDTEAAKMQAWRDETRVALRLAKKKAVPSSLLRLDAKVYLRGQQHLVSYKSRVCEIDAWVELYGDTVRKELTAAEVRSARAIWQEQGYAPKTINHRVRALCHLFHTLDGKKAPTPCDDIDKLDEPEAEPRAVPIRVIQRVKRRLSDSQTRARFMVLAATGQRPAQLKRATPKDINLRKRIWLVRPAKRGRWIPVFLTDDMIAAWRAFIAARAWGHFDSSDYAKRLYDAGWPRDVRPYNAKHTVAIALAEAGAEWEDIRDWFGHTDIKTTRIYTGLVLSRLKRTGQLLAGRLGWQARKQA
jgi:integrase